LFINVLCLFTE